MKKMLWGGLFLVISIFMTSNCFALTVTIDDNTQSQRWVNQTSGGWYDCIGSEEFNTTKAEVTFEGTDLTIKLFTNFSGLGGYGYGKSRGWADDYLYHAADLAIDLDQDGTFETGIALSTHSAPPKDPRPYGDIPGSGMKADNFERNGIYSVDAWFTPDDLHRTTSSVGQLYDENDPKTTYIWMRKGSNVGSAVIDWASMGNDIYEVTIALGNVNTTGKWNSFDFLWGTATCGNDAITGTVAVPEPTTFILSGLGMLTAGIFFMRRRKLKL